MEINDKIAACFQQIAKLLAYEEGESFRVRAYRQAARIVRGLSEPAPEVVRRGAHIPGIGEALAKKILEIEATGTCKFLERLKHDVPKPVQALLAIPGLGPAKVRAITDRFGTDARALYEAAKTGRLVEVPGIGETMARRAEEALKPWAKEER